MFPGILYGLVGALFQSLSYLSSRYFSETQRGSSAQLLLAAHLMMGVGAGLILILTPAELFPPLGSYLLPAFGTTVAFLLAQISIFAALRISAPSRVSPLLGLKIVFVVAATGLIFGAVYTGVQFGAVLLAVAAALVLNYSGGRMPLRALFLTLTACLLLATSDIFIQAAVRPFGALNLFLQGLLPLAISYTMAGVIALLLTPFFGSFRPRLYRDALPFTLAWTGGILLFFTSVAEVGIMYTVILQSSRGLLNVIFGAILGILGFHLIEERHGWQVILRRVSAALMMTGAVALFGLGGA